MIHMSCADSAEPLQGFMHVHNGKPPFPKQQDQIPSNQRGKHEYPQEYWLKDRHYDLDDK